jgi:hypothetical protein
MNTDALNGTSVPGFWRSVCQSAKSHSLAMSRICSQPFRELVLQETGKLISQSPPTCDSELKDRQAQHMQLNAKIGSISHASAMSRLMPEVATQIYESTKKFCDDNSLTSDCALAGVALSKQIATICSTATMRRVTKE